ncbi:trypsin-like peptidase domain-containing protein [Actinomadura barringtoniae]|uniref:Trypsin-like peptidase domain-containing protein n=1 Tax=Actinomadura barringtoniae TaxID=1427535 RepID=A0A939TD00_9ACTN|nr:trypsin-like peptidase domain-containing protein [Actinomadura barringtoniae]MBO2455092.1 trypsin-like peptidase domain-containing protein [Actinomadura barringtoniae]
MTEESREPAKTPSGSDRVVAGLGAERTGDTGEQPVSPETADDLQQPSAGNDPVEPQPWDDPAEPRAWDDPVEPPAADRSSDLPAGRHDQPVEIEADPAAAHAFAPPDSPGGHLPQDDVPLVPGMSAASGAPATAVEMPMPESMDPARHRPGFVPHNQDPRAGYGWPQQASHQPPPPGAHGQVPPSGAQPMGPPPGGPRPMPGPGGYGPPPGGTGPNWAPVPPPPSVRGGGPSVGVLAVIGLIVALVAGGVGAGIGVMASGDDDHGTVSLGSSDGGGSSANNRPPDSIAGVARKVLPSVVMIKVQAANGEGGAGTGFIVNSGYIITNNHVVAGGGSGGSIQVVFNDKKSLPATVKGTDPGSDVAVLKIDGNHNLPPLAVGNSDKIAVGDPVIAVGSPLGLQSSVTTGIVSALNRPVQTRSEEGGDASVLNAIQTDAAINPGNSGGPLVDSQGRVIGINTAIASLGGGGQSPFGGEQQSGSIGLGFAIPINQARRVAEEIINTGGAKRTQLGINMDTRFQGSGVKILDKAQGNSEPIVKGGPAEKAGLKAGDVITKINDQIVDGPADLSAQIRSKAPGDKVKITYERGGKESSVEVTLAAA